MKKLVPEPGEPRFLAFAGIFFTMLDGPKRVHCCISQEALADFVRAPKLSEADAIRCYKTFGTHWHRYCNDRYVLGRVESDGSIIVTSDDFGGAGPATIGDFVNG